MKANLSKKDIIHLLRGVEITDYKKIIELKNIGLGDYTGGFVDSFEWNNTNSESWNKYSEEELYELYRKFTKENEVMKAKEAPEKLYFGENDKEILDIYSTKESDNEVEYVCTDAFIKEVCEWLDDELCCYIKAQEFTIDHARLNKDLRKYLEDEI